MIKASLNQRYAKALFEIAAEKQRTKEYGAMLHDVVELMEQNEDFSRLICGKLVALSAKKQLIGELLSGDEAADVRNFLCVIIDKNRENALAGIAAAYDDVCDAAAGVRQVSVTSAVALTDTEITALQRALGEKLHSTIRIKTAVDKDMIGGLKVQVDDTVYDASLATQLEALKQSLAVVD